MITQDKTSVSYSTLRHIARYALAAVLLSLSLVANAEAPVQPAPTPPHHTGQEESEGEKEAATEKDAESESFLCACVSIEDLPMFDAVVLGTDGVRALG